MLKHSGIKQHFWSQKYLSQPPLLKKNYFSVYIFRGGLGPRPWDPEYGSTGFGLNLD